MSSKYYSELEENKKMFLALKQLVKDKDQLISHLKKQSKAKDQIAVLHNEQMRGEIEKQNLIMRSDLIEQVKSLRSKSD